ncbi:Glycosyltransferase involved in cell wall bisynthesis [Tistlia consotensis]|uniref:Glycosyltransferase involved in cell wall bisynthesis n=1 Tax=Tistlia consotensis USBA 355 TaxID=560819 RepID=A0A1Y6CDZ8_9PROT|nr:glycosyltransferase family A protein [Tistlia consotensis]SMF58944.1 Glycosyltransferase involved in cell wall bisynthesis [Tistlia consotensis USBA 355]SNR64013.1 Glycosyltransferase involved in cell wall bisynthesis [Tistlia consotensis]
MTPDRTAVDPTLVSIIIPTYNRVRVVEQAVASALAQSYPHKEVVVVDDGSSDGTLGRLEALDEPRLRLLSSPCNGGAARARNLGIAASRGGYVAFLDSDDRWEPWKLEAQVARFEQGPPELGLVYCGRRVTLPGGGELEIRPRLRGRVFEELVRRNLVPLPTVMVRRSVLDEIGAFDPLLPACEDWDLVLRIARRHLLDYVAEPGLLYDGSGADRLSGKARAVFIANHLIFRHFAGRRPGRRTLAAHLALQSRELMALGRHRLARRYAIASLGLALESDERLAQRTLRDLARRRPLGRLLTRAYAQRRQLSWH